MDDRRQWHIAWARFTAFKNAPPGKWHLQAVEEFHGILSALETASPGDDLTAFRIPKEIMKPVITSLRRGSYSGRYPGQVTYSDQVYCDPEFAKRQVEGVAAYFEARNPLKR
jgi:hypothetical protein